MTRETKYISRSKDTRAGSRSLVVAFRVPRSEINHDVEWMPDAELLVLVVMVFLRVTTGHRRSLLRVHDGRKRGRPGHGRTELRGRHDGRGRLYPVSRPGTMIPALKRMTAVVGLSSTLEKSLDAMARVKHGEDNAMLSKQDIRSHRSISFDFV